MDYRPVSWDRMHCRLADLARVIEVCTFFTSFSIVVGLGYFIYASVMPMQIPYYQSLILAALHAVPAVVFLSTVSLRKLAAMTTGHPAYR